MKNKHAFYVRNYGLCFTGVVCLFLLRCAGKGHIEQKTPYNFLKQYPTVFTVKGENKDGTIAYTDTLGLFCSHIILYTDPPQEKMHWAYLSCRNDTFILNPDKTFNDFCGIVNDDSELFIHPPREDKYKVLQICPYPYLNFPLALNKTWTWDFNVGSLWCPDSSVQWKGTETFHIKYTVRNTVLVNTGQGEVVCYPVFATSTSRFGQSSLDMYYSFDCGIVKMVYTLIGGRKIEFVLQPDVENRSHFEKSLIGTTYDPYFSAFKGNSQ